MVGLMNNRIFLPPLAKAGEPTPADAQATATVRIPNVTAADNQLSSLIRNLNELKTDDAEINMRIDIERAKIEELKDLIQDKALSAAFKDKDAERKRRDNKSADNTGTPTNQEPALHTLPTILITNMGAVIGWAEITYGKIQKPEGYDAHDDDLYHICVRIFYDWAITDISYDDTDISGLEFPVPSSNYIYLDGYTRSRRSDEYWNMWSGGAMSSQYPNFYTEGFDVYTDPPPGPEKTVNISMQLRGQASAERKEIGNSQDTAIFIQTVMMPSGNNPIQVSYGSDTLRPGSPQPFNNMSAYNNETVIFCTRQDLIEWNELYKAHPDELYEIPLID